MSVASTRLSIETPVEPPAAGAAPLAPTAERLLFWSLVLATVLPVWTTTYFPSQDGPVHLSIVHLLNSYLEGTAGLAADYFRLNPWIEPNLAFYAIGLALVQFTDILTAEKIFLTGLALALCLAVRSAVRSVNPNAVVYSLLVAPTAFHFFVHMGFYNYSLGIALAVATLAFCLRRLGDLTPRNLLLMGLLALLTVLTHLTAFLAVALGVGLAVGWQALNDLWRGTPLAMTVRTTIDRGWRLGLAAAPALLVALAFFVRNGLSRSSVHDVTGDGLASMVTLVSFDPVEFWLMLPWLVTFYGLVLYTLYRHVTAGTLWQSAVWALLPVALLVLFFVNPISTRRLTIADRFIPFIVYFAIIWFATSTPGRLVARLVIAVAVVSTLAGAGFRLWTYDRLNDEIDGYLAAAEMIDTESTVLPIHLRHPLLESTEHVVLPYIHAGAHLVHLHGHVYLRATLLSPVRFGYFPFNYRESVDPYRHIARRLDFGPPEADLLNYVQNTPGQIDYVMLWPTPADAFDDPLTESILAQLAVGWERVPVPPEATTELYRRLTESEKNDSVDNRQ
jgi:hypothetical protein